MRYLIVAIYVLMISSCLNPPDYSEIPAITFDSISAKDVVANKDSIKFYISFTDGDGDLGSETDSNLFITDSRTGFPHPDKIPEITPSGKVKSVSGQIVFTLSEIDSVPDGKLDSAFYTIQILDRAGHLSNQVVSPTVIIHAD